ncbi:fungal-specific transcription factor domain-containing protein [Hypoxylon cercidicola]|nr:fungal-specific transcription factor domain-containing protein [Hypoxylon cercidicola]
MDKTLTSPIGNYNIHCSCDSDRQSKGPGLRLSWPNANDSRRAVVSKSQPPPSKYRDGNGRISDPRIVLVSQGDLETHYQLASSARNGPTLHVPLAWNPLQSEFGDQDLFQYFQSTASQSLAIFPHDPANLGSVLVRIALTNSDTNSANAVQRALLALASIHRHNVYSQAVELKISALKALAAASKDDIGTEEAIQHVAAGMLLCSFEIHQTSCTSGHWICYLDGAKEVIKTFCLDDPAHQHGELSILLDWVYYHDVLARFTQIYWHKGTVVDTSSRIGAEVFHPGPSAMETTELLAKVCDAVSARPPPTASVEILDDYRGFLKILDWRIRNLPVAATADDGADTALTKEVYKLAMLVYLNRATNNVLNQAPRTQQQIDQAFTMLSQMGSCPRQFPAFIIGCEARTDMQRATVLDLMARTERTGASRSFNYVRVLMEAIWAQDDLANGDINYGDKISSVFKRCSNLPTFV